MFLKRKTKRKNLRYFRNVFVTSLLVVLQIVTPIQAVNASSVQETTTLSKDLAIAAISEAQANQYAVDLQTPDSIDLSDNQDVQLTQDTEEHYFFVQNTLKDNGEQTATEINLPKDYKYDEALTKKLNALDKSVIFSYDSKTQKLSIKWSQEAAVKSAVIAITGTLTAKAGIFAETVSQGTTFRSNQLNLISGETAPDTAASESTKDQSSEEAQDSADNGKTNSTTNSTTETSSQETAQGTTNTSAAKQTAETSENQMKNSSANKEKKASVKPSSFDSYDWTECSTNEFLSTKSPTNPNYYEVIGFGGVGGLYWGYMNALQITQEQMFVLKADKVADPDKGPTMDEIKDNAIGYLYSGTETGVGHGGDWDGTVSQGLSITFEDGTIFQTDPNSNQPAPYNESLALKTLEKATSEEGLPMLKASTDTINMGNNHLYKISMILKMLANGRVAHYYSITNMGEKTDTPTVVRAIHTWLAGEHKTQAYALGNNKGIYLKNTLKEDGSLAYTPAPERASDPYRVDFPVDGYEEEANNWLGSHDIINLEDDGYPDLMASVFGDDKANNYKQSTGDEVKDFPADYNLLSEDGVTPSDRDGGIFFKWNDLSIAPGETADIRYDTSLSPIGTLTIDAKKTYKNETSKDDKNHVGDQLTFDLKAQNTSKQIWNEGSIVDVIPEGLTVDPSSFVLVGTDKSETKLSPDVYDASTRTLKVDLTKDVNPNEEVHVKFKATLDKSTAGTTITNTMQAIDASGNSTPASVDIKVEKEDGPLTLDSVPNLNFGLNSIETKDTTYDAYAMESKETAGQYVPNYVQVSDNRAAQAGWTLAVAQTDPFTADSGTTLGSNTEITLTDQKTAGSSEDAVQPSFLADTITLTPNNEEQTVIAASANEGQGTWKSAWGTVETEKRYTVDPANPDAAPELKDTQVNKAIQLMVPGQVKKTNEQYVTNLDWVLSDTPAP